MPAVRSSEKAPHLFSRARKDLEASIQRRRLAGALHGQSCAMDMEEQERLEVRSGSSGFTARCFVCRNRYGVVNLIVLASGVLCCRRCRPNCPTFAVAGRNPTLEVIS